jgi:hypothetical protein
MGRMGGTDDPLPIHCESTTWQSAEPMIDLPKVQCDLKKVTKMIRTIVENRGGWEMTKSKQ